MYQHRTTLLLITFFASFAAGAENTAWQTRDDWAPYFRDAGVTGTIAIIDERNGAHLVYNHDRANKRFIPASTFKVAHALFALDAGVVNDEFEVFHWDGTAYSIPAWNRNQTLRSAMQNSTVWFFQDMARRLGARREKKYLQQTAYGNEDSSGGLDQFWLTGGLRISAIEQLDLLRRLYRNELPFHVSDQRLVKDMMVMKAGKSWILRGKTGWAADMKPQVGWWMGWLELPDGAVFFAMNMETPRGTSDLPERETITRHILRSVGLPDTAETDRFVRRFTLPTGQLIVVTEGEFEPRSVGSYSVRLYSAVNPGFPMDDFQAGLVQARDGDMDKTVLADIDGDQRKELIVIVRSAGTGGYLSAQAFSIDTNTIVLRSSVANLPADADLITALGNALTAD